MLDTLREVVQSLALEVEKIQINMIQPEFPNLYLSTEIIAFANPDPTWPILGPSARTPDYNRRGQKARPLGGWRLCAVTLRECE